MLRVRLPVLAALAAAVLLAACGEDDAPTGAEKRVRPVSLALDFTPNAVHAPLFAARRTGADRRAGIDLRIAQPGSQPDSVKAVLGGRADVGVLDIHDLAIAREAGRDLVAFAALVDRPLAALIALPSVRSPRDLEGETVGVSGLPSDPAFVDAIVADDGGDPEKVKQVVIGFEGVRALSTGRVAAVPAFWNVEGVVLRRRGVDVREFRVERYGAPPYPEVVLFTSRRTLEERGEDLAALVRAAREGMRSVLEDPRAAAREIARAASTDDEDLVAAQLEALRPVVDPSLDLDRAVLERWADFDERIGLVERRPDVERAFAFDLGS